MLQGSKLEIMHKKAWWEAVVIDDEGDRVKLRYVGGSESADEWLEKSSSRLRPQQESVTRKRHAPSKSRGSDEDGEESREAAPERPMRRSRMISDDAKVLPTPSTELPLIVPPSCFRRGRRVFQSFSDPKIVPLDCPSTPS